MKKKVAVLISGRGSNMAALIEACKAPDFPAEIALVLSNRPEAMGLTTARDAGIPTQAINHKGFETRAAFDSVSSTFPLTQRNIDFVCLAGFMRLFADGFVNKWLGRLVNIHPALLPSFKGTHVHEQVLNAGVAITGASVHFTVPEVDSGPIIGQAALPVRTGSVQSLEQRVLAAEHMLYPACLRLLCENKVTLQGGKSVFAPGTERPAFWLSN